MSIIIGIDVGGSTTKIVGFDTNCGKKKLIEPQFIRANDPITATYGAFGKFTDENNIPISEIEAVVMTGVGSSYVKHDLYGIKCQRVPEFNCIGKGGLYLSGLENALVVSMGTGTALVHASKAGGMQYLGGTGVGGGTLVGLSKLLLGAESINHICEFAEEGELKNVDLRIKDITAKSAIEGLNQDMTAANFGNVSDIATKGDIAKGLMNMVFETVGMVSVFAAKYCNTKDIILTGNLTRLAYAKEKFDEINGMGYGIKFDIPALSQFSTVIGCALSSGEIL